MDMFTQVVDLIQELKVIFVQTTKILNNIERTTMRHKAGSCSNLLPSQLSKVCIKIFWRHVCFVVLISFYIVDSLSMPHLNIWFLIRPQRLRNFEQNPREKTTSSILQIKDAEYSKFP